MANSAVVGILKAMLTADTSNYEAGMRKAATTAQTTEKAISGITDKVVKLTPQAERMVKAFGGDKLIYQANSLASAIAKVGGASNLTANEQARVNKVVTEAIDKYRSLGKEAPQALLNLQKETAKTETLLTKVTSTIGMLGPTIAGAFTAGALIGFGKELITFTGDINDLSTETGVAVERVQALNYVGVTAGITFSDMARGIEQLASRVTSGDKGAIAALTRLGISVNSIINESPDEAFIRIGKAIATIERPLERIRIERDLFGKQGAIFGRIFTEDFDQVVKKAEETGPIINKELIDKADAFGDFWAQAWIRFKAGSVVAIGTAIDLMKQFSTASEGVVLPTEQAPPRPRTPLEIATANARTPGQVLGLPSRFVTLPQQATEAEIAKLERRSQQILDNIKHAEEVARAHADLFGTDAIHKAQTYADAIGDIANVSKLSAEKQREVHQAVLEALGIYRAMGREAPESLLRLADATGKLGEKSGDLAMAIRAVADEIHGMESAATIAAAGGMDALYNATARAKKIQEELAKGGFIVPTFGLKSDDIKNEVVEREMSDLQKAIVRDFQQMSQGVSDAFGDMLVHARNFKDGTLDIFHSLQRGIANIFGDILNDYVGGFLRKMLASTASALGARSLGSAIAGSVAGTAAGAGAAAATGGTAATGAGLGFLANPAFWTNPWTIGIGAGIAGAFALKHFLGKSEESAKVNPARDAYFGQFVAMFGGSPYDAALKAHQKAHVSPSATDSIFKMLYGARTYADFQSAERRDMNLLSAGGLRVKMFDFGGFVPPGAIQPAILHGRGVGELAGPIDTIAKMIADRQMAQGPRMAISIPIHIDGVLDRGSVRELFTEHIIPEIKSALFFNTGGLTTAHRDAVTP